MLTAAMAIGCVVLGIALLVGGRGEAQTSTPPVEFPRIALPVTRPGPGARAEQMLERRIAELDLPASTFEEAIQTIATLTQSNIVVHWKTLEEDGLHRDASVRLHLWNVTVRKALRVILDMQEGIKIFSFEPDGEVIVVSDADELQHYAVVTAYNVRDLIQAFNDTKFSSQQNARESLVKLIEDAIAPDTWRDAGGSDAMISELGGILVVRQLSANQQKVAALLEELREGTRRLPTTRAAPAQ